MHELGLQKSWYIPGPWGRIFNCIKITNVIHLNCQDFCSHSLGWPHYDCPHFVTSYRANSGNIFINRGFGAVWVLGSAMFNMTIHHLIYDRRWTDLNVVALWCVLLSVFSSSKNQNWLFVTDIQQFCLQPCKRHLQHGVSWDVTSMNLTLQCSKTERDSTASQSSYVHTGCFWTEATDMGVQTSNRGSDGLYSAWKSRPRVYRKKWNSPVTVKLLLYLFCLFFKYSLSLRSLTTLCNVQLWLFCFQKTLNR